MPTQKYDSNYLETSTKNSNHPIIFNKKLHKTLIFNFLQKNILHKNYAKE